MGAVGLILPALAGIAPILTPVPASGLAVVAVGATIVHARRSELALLAMNVMLAAMAIFVAWGRFGPEAF